MGLFSMPTLLILFTQLSFIDNSDQFFSYFTDSVDSMDFHYASDTVVMATSLQQIKIVDTITRTVSTTITTNFKAAISSIEISSDANYVLAGGSGYEARVYNLGTGTTECLWQEIRGQVTGTTIFDDNNRIAFVTNEGFLYTGNITNCTILRIQYSNTILTSVESLSASDQVWATDYSDTIKVLNLIDNTTTSYTVDTQKLQSIFTVSSTYFGACSQRAFYLIDHSGSIVSSLAYPHVFTKRCRAFPSTSTEIYLTAVSQLQNVQKSGGDFQPLWNIWKISLSPSISYSIYHEQTNENNQYSTSNSQVSDAGVVSISSNQMIVTNIGEGFQPYQNVYGDTSTSGCDSGLVDRGVCQFCVDSDVFPSCNTCNTVRCLTCLPHFFRNSSKLCQACPNNCYTCSSSTVCTSCVTDYVLISNACQLANLTGCATSYFSSVSKCSECMIGYYRNRDQDAFCSPCDRRYKNCTECTESICTECEPNFIMLDPSIGHCQLCSHSLTGCAACINQTYCNTCYDDHPYFDTISSTQRVCQPSCHYSCLTCSHYQYDSCLSCDANRTFSGVLCVCKNTGFIEDPTLMQCLACSEYIVECLNCTSSSYCSTCDTGYYFDDTNATHQSCKTCNYSCETCSNTWYNCSSCDSAMFRVADSTGTMCVCQSLSYFEYGNSTACELCSDFISQCDTCYNQTMCLSCYSGYYIDYISAGNNQCSACDLPCTECFGSATNCSACSTGRQLNNASRTCDCLVGYYPTGTVSCQLCSSVLGACARCTNDTICLQCWSHSYFVMVNGEKKCDVCQQTCLTCGTWTNYCVTCDALANRELNASNNQCECMTGFTQTSGRCLNCGATFANCTSCNLTHCHACENGLSLAYGGLKCVDCQATFPGCILCLDGKCAACNSSGNYELSLSQCICQPGHYRQQLSCLPYAMGARVQRLFPAYGFYQQQISTDLVTITITFKTQGILIPLGVRQSVILTIDGQAIDYSYKQDNTTFKFYHTPIHDIPKASIKLEFVNQTVFDLDEYGPRKRVFQFSKNIYHNTTYDLSVDFGQVYQDIFIDVIRWIFTVSMLLGSADISLILVFTVHFLPSFLLLDLSIPMSLQYMLKKMMVINEKSMFIFTELDLSFQPYETTYVETYNLTGSVIDTKLTDIITLTAIILFYSLLGPIVIKLAPEEGKLSKILEYKFIFKRYSTFSNLILCFAPTFLLSAAVNFSMQQTDPSVMLSSGFSLLVISALGVFAFFHAIVLLITQFDQNFKNEECYLGSSQLEGQSVAFVLSFTVLICWGISLMRLAPGYVTLPIVLLLLLWNFSYYRKWDNFPNKISFFTKIFYSLTLIVYVGIFLTLFISEKYAKIDALQLQIMGLASLVLIIILIGMALFETLFIFLQTFYRLCKMNSSIIENIEEEPQQKEQSKDEFDDDYEIKYKITDVKHDDLYDQYETPPKKTTTNKRQHMNNFKKRHLGATGDNFESRSRKKIEMSRSGPNFK